MPLFKKLVYFERFRNRGVDLTSRFKQLFKWNEIKEGAFYGSIGKLALFGEIAKIHFWFIDMGWLNSVQVWQLIVLNVIYSYLNDIMCFFVANYYYHKKLEVVEAEMFAADGKVNPVGLANMETMSNIAEKLGVENKLKKYLELKK
jgi:hypothetical protein